MGITIDHFVLQRVTKERNRQDELFGTQNHDPVEWLPILMEEIGEASREALEYHFSFKNGTTSRFSQKRAESLRRYEKELVQVAAVAIAMLESFQRNEAHVLNYYQLMSNEEIKE